MKGPSLWFDTATLNVILDWLIPPSVTVPVTVSPTWNTPDFILISKILGTQCFVTSTPSKKAYTLVCGLKPLPSKAIFLDLIIGMTSLFKVLSPNDSWSYCSVIKSRDPSRVPVPILKLSVNVSWIVFKVEVVTIWFPKSLLCLSTSSVLVVVLTSRSVPVQTVCQPCHTISVKPVWGSNPCVLSASFTVLAKLPSTSITFASSLTVSTQTSDAGVRSRLAFQKLSKKGVTLSVLVPNGWSR